MESKKIEFFNKLSFIILLATIFLSLFFFVPYVPVTLDTSKGFLLSVGTMLSVLFWLIARLGEGKFTFPKDRLILVAGLIPLVFLIASFFSPSLYISLFGSGFEIGTFGSMLILYVLLLLSSIYFNTEKRLWYFIGSLFLGAIILSIFELVNIFFWRGNLPRIFTSVSSGNLIGSWNSFALFFGMIVLLCLITIEFLKTRRFLLFVQYFLLVIGLFFLIIINMPFAWLLVGFLSAILFVYNMFIQYSGAGTVYDINKKKKFPFSILIVLLLSLSFLIVSNFLGSFVSRYIKISNTEVRPNITTTSQIAWKSIKHNPLFGTGPNTFVIDWSLWQPRGVAQSFFWNIDFLEGSSTLFTFIITTGILGLFAWILFFTILLIRGIQSLRIALKDSVSNYFLIATFFISLYSWIVLVLYSSNIIILMLAFVSSGVLVGVLSYRHVIRIKSVSFLGDPRNSFFAILSLMILMIGTLSMTYLYAEKFTSIIYFSKSLSISGDNMNSLVKAENMIINAISLDQNDAYYRALSQIYIAEIKIMVSDKTISQEILKNNLQKLIDYAQNSAQIAVSRNSKQYLNYMNLGDVYASFIPLSVENSYESAIASYNKAISLAPMNPSIILRKAQIEVFKKNNIEARKLIDQALELKLNYSDALILLSQIESSEGNTDASIKQMERAVKLNQNDPTIFFRLGLLRYNSGDYNNAISAFSQAVVLDNTYLNARFFLGKSYQKVGRSIDALLQFKILSNFLPDNQDIKDAINILNGVSVSSNASDSSITTDNQNTSTTITNKNKNIKTITNETVNTNNTIKQ